MTPATTLQIRAVTWLVLTDIISIVIGIGSASAIRSILLGDDGFSPFLFAIMPIYFFIAIRYDAFSLIQLNRPYVTAKKGVYSLLLTAVSIIIVLFSLKVSYNLSRSVFGAGLILASVTMFGLRYLFAHNYKWFVGGNPFSIVVICDGEKPPATTKKSSIIMANDEGLDPDVHDPAMYDRLAKVLQNADRAIISCPPARRLAWAHALKGVNVKSEIWMPDLQELAPLGVDAHAGTSTVIVSAGPLNLSDRVLKRLFDLAFASVALVVLSPVLLLVALAIKLDTPGPVLFRQPRLGRDNETFEVLKFRSMHRESADGSGLRSTSRGDERVTRVGRFIRATSLDELPQLLNIVLGDMSVVGPRPHALGSRAATKLFWEIDVRYWHRHAAKPGLTGLAQVRGFRGATENESDLSERLHADLEYLENWSIWRDIKIIAMTFRVIFHRNAY